MIRQPLFSVIVPVYNCEIYLEDAIKTIINQSIGFENNIQLIFVDDCSNDGSVGICKKYVEKYSDNVILIQNEYNSGVSATRNKGLECATGEYIVFLDADDNWDINAFIEIKKQFDSHPECVIASCRIKEFEARNNYHFLDYKFKTNMVVDLSREDSYKYIQSTIGGVVVKQSAIENERFNENLSIAEDSLFVNTIMLKNMKLLIIKDAVYNYRKHAGGDSLSSQFASHFIHDDYEFAMSIINNSKSIRGKVEPFIQGLVFYQMHYHFMTSRQLDLSERDKQYYRENCKKVLQYVEDDIIFKQKKIALERKICAFRIKYGDDFYSMVNWEKGIAYYNGTKVFNLNKSNIVIYSLKIRNNQLLIKGYTDLSMLNSTICLYVSQSNNSFDEVELIPFSTRDRYTIFNTQIVKGERFEINIPVSDEQKIKFYIKIGNQAPYCIKPIFRIFAKLSEKYSHAYYRKDHNIIFRKGKEICIEKESLIKTIKHEVYRILEIIKYAPKNSVFTILKLRFRSIRRKGNKEELWLLSDRNQAAGDNAGNLFKYLSQHPVPNQRYELVLSKKSQDYKEMAQRGKIIEPNSYEHMYSYLCSDKIISAHADNSVINPFNPEWKNFLKDLIDFDFIYLQHGVMQGDLSSWLNTFKKNIELITVSTEMESNNLLDEAYGYSKDVIQATGMARCDALGLSKPKRRIIFCPTWRSSLAAGLVGDGREREYIKGFKETDYCRFYNTLINDERLKKIIKQSNFEAVFYIHPSFEKQIHDFVGNDVIKVSEKLANYEKELNEAALMITDYSGVAFDFGYQYKPVVYCQFDDLYANGKKHSYSKAYYNYQSQGFGPVTKTVSDTVDEIIRIIKNNCNMPDEYKERVNKFFYYVDFDNCKRIAESINRMWK